MEAASRSAALEPLTDLPTELPTELPLDAPLELAESAPAGTGSSPSPALSAVPSSGTKPEGLPPAGAGHDAPALSLAPDDPPTPVETAAGAAPTEESSATAQNTAAAAAVAPSSPAAPRSAAPVAKPAATTAPPVARPAGAAVPPAPPTQPGPAKSGTATAAQTATAPAAAPQVMDRDFIARNQIVERYLSGKLPIKGATEFERYCKEHPDVLDELGLPERVNAALRLLEASGKPEPWQESPRKLWEKPPLIIGLAAAVLGLTIAVGLIASNGAEKARQIAALEKKVVEQPLDPATSTRTIRLLPSRKGSSNTPAVMIGGGATQLADLKIDVSRSSHRNFRVTIDRIDQGRVAVLHNLAKDSNGHLRLALNSSALGPGNYQLTIEGLNWRGQAEPDSWITIGVQR